MAKKRTIRLSKSQQRELEKNRDHHPEAYVRERCSAILKVAAGETAYTVARQGLLKARDPDSVYGWLTMYETEGLAGLIARRQGGNHRRSL